MIKRATETVLTDEEEEQFRENVKSIFGETDENGQPVLLHIDEVQEQVELDLSKNDLTYCLRRFDDLKKQKDRYFSRRKYRHHRKF